MQKKLLLLITTAIVIFTSSIAVARPPQPSVCPPAAAIKNAGVSRNAIEIDTLWFAGRRHMTYTTGDVWTFVMGNIPAVNSNDAYQKATQSLDSLFLQSGPFYDSEWKRWVCMYASANGYPAVAVNPAVLNMDSSLKDYMKY